MTSAVFKHPQLLISLRKYLRVTSRREVKTLGSCGNWSRDHRTVMIVTTAMNIAATTATTHTKQLILTVSTPGQQRQPLVGMSTA
jgi:hypothetical protein